MRRVAAPLAAVLCGLAIAACGDGAEPGAPEGATLVLDFTPNAVHAGLYAARERGYFEEEGLELEIREPSSSADSAKLLEAGRADFAVMDINDFGIARERGLGIVAIAAIVQRPLASVIAADRDEVQTPADLAGKTVGVTGVPSDDAVLDTVLAAGGLEPGDVERKTIGFESVPLLAAGEVDAATAFWNAEGVALAEQGAPTREFRVDEFGAPRYPELVVAATARTLRGKPEMTCAVAAALDRSYEELPGRTDESLSALLDAVPALDAETQAAQLDSLVDADAFNPEPHPATRLVPPVSPGPSAYLDRVSIEEWIAWAGAHRIVAGEGLLGTFKYAPEQVCPPAQRSTVDDFGGID